MQKEKWQNQFGYLEEQIERLQSIAFSNEAAALDPLSPPPISLQDQLKDICEQTKKLEKLVNEEVFQQKNVSAVDLLAKISRFLMEEAEKNQIPLSFSYYGSGKLSMQVVEQIMPIIVFSVKACIANYSKDSLDALRAKNNLFHTCSVFLELKFVEDSATFRIIDDGFGYENGKKSIRESVAKYAGWARFSSFPTYGASVEIKIPIQKSRTDSMIFSYGPHRVGVPYTSVHEQAVSYKKNDLIVDEGFCYVKVKESLVRACTIHPNFGLQFVEDGAEYLTKELFATVLGVADFQIAILTEKQPERKLLRVIDADTWVTEEAWFQSLGLYSDIQAAQALPFIDGASLMNFYKKYWV